VTGVRTWRRGISLAALALWTWPGPRAAADDLPTLPEDRRPTVTLDLAEPEGGAHTGDLTALEVRVTTRHPDDEVAIPTQPLVPEDAAPGAGMMELHARRAEVDPDDPRRHRFVLDLLALAPGPVTVGPLRVRVVTHDGLVGAVETPPLAFEVRSVLGNEPDPAPRPPGDPVSVYEDDYTLAWLLGSLLFAALVAAATLLIARWWRRRPATRPAPTPPRPPWDVALDRLRALRRGRVQAVEDGRADAWADSLSDVLREYLGARCGFDGLESTTDEVIARVEASRPDGLRLAEVVALLGDCDLVKFAKAPLDEGQGEALLDAAERMVRATTPHPQDDAAGRTPGGGPGGGPAAPPRQPSSAPPGTGPGPRPPSSPPPPSGGARP